jgi:hypothetical protein
MGFKKGVIESQITICQDKGVIPHEFGVIYRHISNMTAIRNKHECRDHGWFSDSTTFLPRSNFRNLGNEGPSKVPVAGVDSSVVPSVSSIYFVSAGMKRDSLLHAMPVEIGGIGSPTFLPILKASDWVTTSMGRVNAVISICELTKVVSYSPVWRVLNETAPLSPFLSDRWLFLNVDMVRLYSTLNC